LNNVYIVVDKNQQLLYNAIVIKADLSVVI